MSIAVDVDDTIIDISHRSWVVWCQVLGQDISYEVVRDTPTASPPADTTADDDVWDRFWSIMLCMEDRGIELLSLDRPRPYASEVLRRWNENHEIVYFTGRPMSMYELTLNELGKFDFPDEKIDLVMLNLKDSWKWFIDLPSAIQYRNKLFSKVCQKHKVFRVVDDYAPFFSVYKKFRILERIGIQVSKRHLYQDYLNYGATKVFKNWKEMENL